MTVAPNPRRTTAGHLAGAAGCHECILHVLSVFDGLDLRSAALTVRTILVTDGCHQLFSNPPHLRPMTDWNRPEEKGDSTQAACVNKIILVGYLGKDPEQRFTQSGRPVTSFTVATSETWKLDDGEREQRTEWFNVVIWNRLAEVFCKTYLPPDFSACRFLSRNCGS